MAIKITDNFQLNISNPIDNRFVVGSQSITSGPGSIYPTPFYAYRDDISSNIGFVYPGLRIWDFNDNLPYVWTGTTWSNENMTGASVKDSSLPTFSSSGGYRNYITKFYDTGTVLTKSLLYDDNSHVSLGNVTGGVNPNGTIGSAGSLTQGLHVQGRIRTNTGFVGVGSYITNIDASNIEAGPSGIGTLNLQLISRLGTISGPTYLLTTNNGVNTWAASNTISVASADVSIKSNINDSTSIDNHYITFVEYTGNVPIKVSLSKLQFKPSNGQLFLSDGSATEPVYSFINSVNSGIYYNGYINFSRNGLNKMSITNDGIVVYSQSYPQIQFTETTTNKNRLLWVSSSDDLLFRTDTSLFTTDKRVWHQDNLFTLKSLGNKSAEVGRNLNITTTNAGTNDLIKGIYTHNVYGTTITPSTQVHWSVISFGKGDEGSVQLASNWYGSNTQNGNVVADRDILIRSLRDTIDSWSPWVKIWNSGNSGYVPFGSILMWSGLTTQIPTGWKLCDGSAAVTIPAGSVPGQPSITSITIPDLRERFIVGAGIEQSKLVFDYGTTFQLKIPPVSATTIYTFTVNTTTPYYVNSSGVVKTGVNPIDGFSYHLYKVNGIAESSGSFLYMIYDNRFGAYEVIQGVFPSSTGVFPNGSTVKWMGKNKGGTTYYTANTEYPLNNDTHLRYDKYFSLGRRVAFTEIVWPLVTSSGYNTGDKGGADIIVLEGSQMVKHQHDSTFGEHNGAGDYGNANDNNGYGSNGGMDGDNNRFLTSAYGNNQPIENRPPYYALAFIIYTGI